MAALSRVFGACRVLSAKTTFSSAAGNGGEGKGGSIRDVLPVSQTLANFVGANEIARTTAVKKIWEHIKHHKLQNPVKMTEIKCDEKLKSIYNGKDTVTFGEISKLLDQYFPKRGSGGVGKDGRRAVLRIPQPLDEIKKLLTQNFP